MDQSFPVKQHWINIFQLHTSTHNIQQEQHTFTNIVRFFFGSLIKKSTNENKSETLSSNWISYTSYLAQSIPKWNVSLIVSFFLFKETMREMTKRLDKKTFVMDRKQFIDIVQARYFRLAIYVNRFYAILSHICFWLESFCCCVLKVARVLFFERP